MVHVGDRSADGSCWPSSPRRRGWRCWSPAGSVPADLVDAVVRGVRRAAVDRVAEPADAPTSSARSRWSSPPPRRSPLASPARPRGTWRRSAAARRRSSRSSRRARAGRTGTLGAAVLAGAAAVLLAARGQRRDRRDQRLAALAAERQLVPGGRRRCGGRRRRRHWSLSMHRAGRSPRRRRRPPTVRRRSTRSRPSRRCAASTRHRPLRGSSVDGDRHDAAMAHGGSRGRTTASSGAATSRCARSAAGSVRTASATSLVGSSSSPTISTCVPLPGAAVTVDAAVETDAGRRRGPHRRAARARHGRARRRSTSSATPDDTAAATVATRPIDEHAAAFTATARGTGVERRPSSNSSPSSSRPPCATDFALDPDAPGAGVQQALLERFVRDTRRGTAEQFVAAFVLLARSLGVDAAGRQRVRDPRGRPRAPGRSRCARTWPPCGRRCASTGVGWVPFDPVPPDETSRSWHRPRRHRGARPRSPRSRRWCRRPSRRPTTRRTRRCRRSRPATAGGRTCLRWAGRVGTAVAAIVVPLVVGGGADPLAQAAPRRRLLGAPTPVERARGAWAVSHGRAHGRRARPSTATWTDRRIADRGRPVAAGVDDRAAAGSPALSSRGDVRPDVRRRPDAVRRSAA